MQCTPWLIRNCPSLSPQATYKSRSLLVTSAGSFIKSAGHPVFGADGKPPTQANVSRGFSQKLTKLLLSLCDEGSSSYNNGRALVRIVFLDDREFTMNSSEKVLNPSLPFRSVRTINVMVAVWVCSVVAGMLTLAKYSSAPGIAAGPPRSFPTIAEFPRQSSRPLLVMFVHPKCPCSRASINELARLVARCRDRMDLTALFVVPPGCSPEWHKTALWENANAIPGLRVIVDLDGRLASEFAVTTSGHCLVYDAQENLVFSGGITTGRGHEGDSLGRAIVTGIVLHSTFGGPRECSAYGCPLTADQVQSK